MACLCRSLEQVFKDLVELFLKLSYELQHKEMGRLSNHIGCLPTCQTNITFKQIDLHGERWPPVPLSPEHWNVKGSKSNHVPPPHQGFSINKRYSIRFPVSFSGTANHLLDLWAECVQPIPGNNFKDLKSVYPLLFSINLQKSFLCPLTLAMSLLWLK